MTLRKQLESEARERLSRHGPARLVTEADLDHLPAPLQRYLRYTRIVDRPRAYNFKASFDGEIARARNAAMTRFRADQYSFFDPPARLFLIRSAMFGIPFAAYHRYAGAEATMRVRVAGLFTPVDARGPEMNRSETVTMFNDMCILAPSTLIDRAITWQPVDDLHVRGTYTNAGNTISAVLTFDDSGALADFVSNDRYQTSDGKTYLNYPWSTPMKKYSEFDGVRVASDGVATWREPSGDFTYGHFVLRHIEYNLPGFSR